jgi:hypothetical protein
MTGRRIARWLGLLALASSLGCRSWCEKQYPCQAAAPCCAPVASPACCQPCQPCAPVPPCAPAGYPAAPAFNAPTR